MKEIYQQTVEEVFERVKGNISGLTSEQVKSSREKCGWKIDWKCKSQGWWESTHRREPGSWEEYGDYSYRSAAWRSKEYVVFRQVWKSIEDENYLVFFGLIAMMNPPREESKTAVTECIRAGIRMVHCSEVHMLSALFASLLIIQLIKCIRMKFIAEKHS